MRRGIYIALFVCGCSSRRESIDVLSAEFVVDAPRGGEAWTCTAIPADDVAAIARIEWSPPNAGAVLLHHATLYAVADVSDVAARCEEMPENAVSLHVFAQGGDAFALRDGRTLRVPEGTTAFVVQAHAARLHDGAASPGSVAITRANKDSATARWLGIRAPVPAIRPHTIESAGARCRIAGATRMLAAWPHMHAAGRRIELTRVRGGTRAVVARVDPWNFDRQRTMPLDIDVEAADVFELRCTWENASAQYIFPGPRTVDEMCNLGLVVTPAESAVTDCSAL